MITNNNFFQMFSFFKNRKHVIKQGTHYSQTKFLEDIFIFDVFIALYVGKSWRHIFRIRFLGILIVVRLNKLHFWTLCTKLNQNASFLFENISLKIWPRLAFFDLTLRLTYKHYPSWIIQLRLTIKHVSHDLLCTHTSITFGDLGDLYFILTFV